ERSILGAIERVLADPLAHLALRVGPGEALGQPTFGREEPRECRLERLDTLRIVRHGRHLAVGFVDERPNLRDVDQESECAVIVGVVRTAHRSTSESSLPVWSAFWNYSPFGGEGQGSGMAFVTRQCS